jgi:glyoxylase-like metal-dependent hydrolase (beta-lactamase superfamily II)
MLKSKMMDAAWPTPRSAVASRRTLVYGLLALVASMPAAALAESAPRPAGPPEPPSPVNAHYVDPSSTTPLTPGDKINHLFNRNNSQPYVLQRLTKRTYWVQHQNYSATFYVGDKGVLLFDAPERVGETMLKAVAEVTKLPVTALVLSHDHADHIADTPAIRAAAAQAKTTLRIIASKATSDKMTRLKSSLPKPTETVAWPKGSFKFEGLTVELHGFVHAAHTDDHSAWLLRGEKVVHLPDHVNPDQPPFWAWAGSETFVNYEQNLEELGKLEWDYLNGGHGNVGSKADLAFYRAFIGDMKQAVGKALSEVKFGDGVDMSKVNSHTPFLTTFLSTVAKKATDALRPKYGQFYGFEYATPRNAEMVAMTMFAYR